MMENLFDSLCSCLMLSSNRERFLKGEGLQLMNLMLRCVPPFRVPDAGNAGAGGVVFPKARVAELKIDFGLFYPVVASVGVTTTSLKYRFTLSLILLFLGGI